MYYWLGSVLLEILKRDETGSKTVLLDFRVTGVWCFYRLVMACRKRNVREGRFLYCCTLAGRESLGGVKESQGDRLGVISVKEGI
jgi:hypothetical protein